MSNPSDDSQTKGRGSLIALAVLALSAAIPLTMADAAERGKAGISQGKKKPRAARSETPVPGTGDAMRRKLPVGIPGRPYR